MSAFHAVRPSEDYKRARFYYRKALLGRRLAFIEAASIIAFEAVSLVALNDGLAAKGVKFLMPLCSSSSRPSAAFSIVLGACCLGYSFFLAQNRHDPVWHYANLRVKGAKRGMKLARAKQVAAAGPS